MVEKKDKKFITCEMVREAVTHRVALSSKIDRFERDLRNSHWIFLLGLGLLLLGVFLFWLIFSNATLFTIGQTRFVADLLSFGVFAVVFTFGGILCMVLSIYARISYPSKIETLKGEYQKLDDILRWKPVFQKNPGWEGLSIERKLRLITKCPVDGKWCPITATDNEARKNCPLYKCPLET